MHSNDRLLPIATGNSVDRQVDLATITTNSSLTEHEARASRHQHLHKHLSPAYRFAAGGFSECARVCG